jgi:hypothetical protein
LIESIESKDETSYIKKVSAYVKMTPFDKVKNQLVAKIKEIYVPDASSLGGVVNKLSKLDFTGADKDEEVKGSDSGANEDDGK